LTHYYVLEDQPPQQQRLQQIIGTCQLFDQPAPLLAALQADRQPKVILIDLALHHVVHAGLNVAQAIRSFDSLSPIIIVSTHTELLAMSYQYQIGALDFVDKSLCEAKSKQRIRSAIRVANHHLALQTQQTPEIVTLPSSHQREIVDVNDMIYIASNVMASHRATIYCEQRQIDLRATMKTLADLSDKLIQIHAAYVINRDKICYLDRHNHTVILDTCVALPYSKRHFKQLQTLLKSSIDKM